MSGGWQNRSSEYVQILHILQLEAHPQTQMILYANLATQGHLLLWQIFARNLVDVPVLTSLWPMLGGGFQGVYIDPKKNLN